MDTSSENEMYGDIDYDMDDFLSTIEIECSNPIRTQIVRNDTFKTGFENIFNVSIDDIDDIEDIMANMPNSESIVERYQYIADKLKLFYNRSWGISFFDGDGVVIDLNKLYSIYRVLYLRYFTFISQCVAGRAKLYDIEEIDINVVRQTIDDENEFTFENIRRWLNICDTGNEDYEYIFGEYDPSDYIDDKNLELSSNSTPTKFNEVIIDNDIFRTNLCSWLSVDRAEQIEYIEQIVNKATELLKHIS